MRYGRHVFVVYRRRRARAWLRNMFDRVNARREEHGIRFTVNIGFTYEGLKALGVSQPSLESFPQAFRDGMRGRARAVGDVGPHAPEHWEGGLGGPDIHAMGWIRTDSDEGRDSPWGSFAPRWRRPAGSRSASSRTDRSRIRGIGSEEHFGFADPISQPPIEGADTPWYPGDGVLRPDGTWRPLKPGEFVLGYEDEAGPQGTQAPDPPELRLNGTYMVFRKLYQDVAAFRRYLATAGKSPTAPMTRITRNCRGQDGPGAAAAR
jgi:deferrochelatase/peroxidase EfeB